MVVKAMPIPKKIEFFSDLNSRAVRTKNTNVTVATPSMGRLKYSPSKIPMIKKRVSFMGTERKRRILKYPSGLYEGAVPVAFS